MKGGGRDRVGVTTRAVFRGELTASTRSPDLEEKEKTKQPNPREFSFMAVIVMSVSQVTETVSGTKTINFRRNELGTKRLRKRTKN